MKFPEQIDMGTVFVKSVSFVLLSAIALGVVAFTISIVGSIVGWAISSIAGVL